MLRRFSRRTPWVERDQIHQGPTLTAAERQVRVPVQVAPHAAPDPPRDGFVPSRPAMVPITTFFLDTQLTVQDDRFQEPNLIHNPLVATPAGRQQPWTERQNIAVPAAVAYGSMLAMNYQPDPYWS